MTLFDQFKKRSTLDAAVKQVAQARKSDGGKAEQLYKGAYQGFAGVINNNPLLSEALYHWGFALLHEAKTQSIEAAIETLEDAISKFSFCLLTAPNYLAAAIDGGVAFMELARISPNESQDYLYKMAQQFFEKAGNIQKGSAAYNLACIHAINGEETACEAALTLAKESGSLPEQQAIVQDEDLSNVFDLVWFKEFLQTLQTPDPEIKRRPKDAPIDFEPKFNLKKSEDFDYYSSKSD